MKKISLLLIATMLISLMPWVVQAENNEIGNVSLKGSINANGLQYKTNADVTDDGLKLVAATTSQNPNKYPPYDTSVEKAELSISVSDYSKEEYQNVTINVSYADIGYGWFAIKYSSENGGIKYSSPVCLTDSHEEKVESITLNDMVFGKNINSGYDFCITTYKNDELYGFSQSSVYITNVGIITDNTVSPVDVSLTSKNSGNIFFTGESVRFDAEYRNMGDEPANITVDYSVYNSNNDIIMSDQTNHNIINDGSENEEVAFEIQNYGLYRLDTHITGTIGEKTINTYVSRKFSKCIYNDTLNKTFGAAAHVGNGRGDAQASFELMRKAGMGVVREAPHWYSYETERGSGSLSDTMRKSLKVSSEKGIDRILTVLCRNPYIDQLTEVNSRYSLPSLDVMDELGEYVTEYMSLPEVKNSVTMVEVENEPENAKYIDGISIENDSQRYEKAGKRYAHVLKTVGDAVKSVSPGTPVGGFTVGNIKSDNIKNLVSSGLTELSAIGGNNSFDVFTMHPYMGKENPDDETDNGSLVAERIGEYDRILEEKGFNVSQKWFTEMGFSSSTDKTKSPALGSDYEVAKKIIRQYACMKEIDNNYVSCIYDLINDSNITNMSEGNFGLLDCYKDVDVPYAAKNGFLAVAAMNKLTCGATSVNRVYSQNNMFVSCFDMPERKTYMLWTSNTDGQNEIPYDFGENVNFYDMLGNLLNKNNVLSSNGTIKVTDSPIFAVTGAAIEETADTTISKGKTELHISGDIPSGEANKMVSLTVLPTETAFDKNMIDNIKYVDQTLTDSEGIYSFDAVLDDENDFFAYTVDENSKEYKKFSIISYKDDASLALRSGMIKLNSLNIDLVDISRMSAEVTLNIENEGMEYTLFCALYKDGKLVNVTNKTKTFAQGQSTTSVFDVHVSDNSIAYDKIKLMLWNGTGSLVPLCDVCTYE